MATKKDNTDNSKDELANSLSQEASNAWDALTQLRETWDEKEQALLAKTNDTFSGNVTRAKVTDAALSTLAFERQARVSAQLPTGTVLPAGKKDRGKAKLANIILQRYIIPNANSQHDMLIKQRLWGVYASVYGSMPMFYDYRVDDQYIGPDCWLIDPRSFLPQPGRNSIQEMEWVMVSTIVNVSYLEDLSKKDKKKTSWNTEALKDLVKQAKDGKPSRHDDSEKDSVTSRTRYSKELSKGQVELITKYEAGEDGHWQTFAPDYKAVGVLRDIPNPHKSGKIPVVMRHCFPLLNSIYGLGDFERGMKLQKAKDSLLSLNLEFTKNKVYPALKINSSQVTMSTIKHGAGRKWLMTDMNAVQPVQYGSESQNEFQAAYSQLQGMLMNQFGTTDTSVNAEDTANPGYGKTPQALAMLQSRENARDTWDRFMHEKAVEELYEGMINLLSVKMEKPIDFTIFEEDIRQLANDYGEEVLEVIEGNKLGKLTIPKSKIKSDRGFRYVIDANSSMKKDDDTQLQAQLNTWTLVNQNPQLAQVLAQRGYNYDPAEHLKKIFILSGISDWETILQEGGQDSMGGNPQQMQQEQMMQQQMQEQAMQEEMMRQQQAQQAVAQSQQAQQQMLQGAQFNDPDIQAFAQQALGGQ